MGNWYWTDLLPILYICFTVIGYSSLFLVSWVNCHLSIYRVPKISHLGAEQPELQFFAFLCILQAWSFGNMVHYVYNVWKLVIPKHKLIQIAYWMGMMSVSGLVLIGCFQVNQAADIHFSGAFLCFILGGFYFCITTLITCSLQTKCAYFKRIYRWRLLLTGLILVCIAVLIVSMTVKQHIYNQQGEIETVTELIQGCNNITYEKMTEGYYTWEMYSSMTEWISCVIYLLYVYTYRHEVKLIGRSKTSIAIKQSMQFTQIQSSQDSCPQKVPGRHGWSDDDASKETTDSLLTGGGEQPAQNISI